MPPQKQIVFGELFEFPPGTAVFVTSQQQEMSKDWTEGNAERRVLTGCLVQLIHTFQGLTLSESRAHYPKVFSARKSEVFS